MKQNGNLAQVMEEAPGIVWDIEDCGDQHWTNASDTPLRADAALLSDAEKIDRISGLFREIMDTLGLDLTDDSLRGTPKRVARMYVEEIFRGLNPQQKPAITLFENKYRYNQMLVEKNITVHSNCEHHFVPISGFAHVGYISSGKVIGLSKLNRLVDYYARRPQVQERLTMQIGKELQEVLETEDVVVMIDAKHFCVSSRGIQDNSSSTITTFRGGCFEAEQFIKEFLSYLQLPAVL